MKRKVTRFVVKYMLNFGIDVINKKGTTYSYYKSLIVISLLLALLASIFAYINVNRNEYKYVAYASAFSLEVINTIATYLYFLATKKRIRILLQNIDANIFVYTNEEEITPTYSSLLKEENMVLIFVITLAYLIGSIILAFLTPFLTIFLTNNQELIIEVAPVWLPFDNEIGLFLFQVFPVFALGGVLYAKWIFSSFLLFEYERQCIRLCDALKTLEDRSLTVTQQRMNANDKNEESEANNNVSFMRRMANVNFRNAYSKIVQENLIQCIHHHQRLVE